MEQRPPTPPRVVIVGGGFAGLACARTLAKHQDVRVTLIDKNNYHQFQPLLYQVASAELGTGDVATSIRETLRGHANVDVKLSEVMIADPCARTVTTRDGQSYQGDFLVLAAGSVAFAPNSNATVGDVGESNASNDSYARAKSRTMSVRTRCALP